MDSFHIVLFGFFVVVAYFVVTDESVAAAFYYVLELGNQYIKRQWWWLMNNPKNPVVKYIIYRRSVKMAEEILSKINTDKEKE